MTNLQKDTVVYFVAEVDQEAWIFEPTILKGKVEQVFADGLVRVVFEENDIHWSSGTFRPKNLFPSAKEAADAFIETEAECLAAQVKAFT